MMTKTVLSITLLVSALFQANAYYVEEDYRELERDPHFVPLRQEKHSEEGFDDDFGTDLDKFVTKNPLKCPYKCEYNLDCCKGNICLKTGKGIGYCVKGCKNTAPAAPLKDCRLCMTCTEGYVCTLRLNGEYICMPDNRTGSKENKSKRGYLA